MSKPRAYEYAEVITGLIQFEQRPTPLLLLYIRENNEERIDLDFKEGRLGALNLMGAEGWKLASERPAPEARIQWAVAQLPAEGAQLLRVKRFEAVEFLMMRKAPRHER